MNLHDFYKKKIIFDLFNKLNYSSIMQVPKITKITINMGVGKAILDKKFLEKAMLDLTLISGQKPIITKARKSIAGFKIRKDYPIGCKVTLRNKRMWQFFERLICIVIPRIRDFRGMSLKSFDGFGNYNLGIREQIIFPEIDYNTIDCIRGLDISINTSAKFDNEAILLFNSFNFPFCNNIR